MTIENIRFTVTRTASDYLHLLKAGFPSGWLFAKIQDAGSLWSRAVEPFAKELLRLETNALKMVNEGVPGLSEDLLPEWQKEFGLPEAWVTGTVADNDMRMILQNRENVYCPSPTAAWFVSFFAEHGVGVSVDESPAYDEMFTTGGSIDPDITRVGSRLSSNGKYYYWTVTYGAGLSTLFKSFIKFHVLKFKPAETMVGFIEI